MNKLEGLNNKSAGRIINQLSRMAHMYFNSEFKKYSIGHAQIPTLIFIAKNEGVSLLEISKHLKLDKSSVTSQITILEKNGYIVRCKSKEDARVHQLNITAKTREILMPMKIVFSSWTETLFDGFTIEEREQVFKYLERMRENAKNKLQVNKNSCNED